MKIVYKDNWTREVPSDIWVDFLEFTKSDEHCNYLWDGYKARNIPYEVVSKYEHQLYIKFIRDISLSLILK